MTVREHVFSSPLNTSYNRQSLNGIRLSNVKTIDKQQLFYFLNRSENYHYISTIAYDFICYHLVMAEDAYSATPIHHYHDVGSLVHLNAAPYAPLPQHLSVLDNQLECVRQTRIIYDTQPCWLEKIFQISSSQSKIAVEIMAIYSDLKGCGQDKVNISQSYKALLLMLGIKHPVLYTQAFTGQTLILNQMYVFASIQLALTRFPRLLFAEIIGFTLAFCQMPTLIETCFPNHSLSSSFFKLRQQKVEQALPAVQHCIADYLSLFPQQKNQLWVRIQKGFLLYQQQMLCCREQLNILLEKQPTPQQRIIQIFKQKAVAAIGHHQKIFIEGISLDRWISGLPENGKQFLLALKKSAYVDCNNPEKSLLLTLFDFDGPMLGVLNNTERGYLLDWLKTDEREVFVTYPVETVATSTNKVLEESVSPVDKYEKLDNRTLYYYLINADLFPDVRLTAQKKINKLLGLCDFFCHVPFKSYSHDRLDAYISAIYQREMAGHKPLKERPKISKAAYIWGLEQIAPMILIDGCWLQNSLTIENTYPEIAEILFSIYCDEIGNAVLEQNHPYIFQQLLDSLSIDVPPVYSKTFIQHPDFINSAFDLPVYMLALSQFSVQFLPELLGLNMAIELSGLGKNYMQLVDDWNYWGIDSTIVRIHISIDNYASGHTFLAKKAIKIYLDHLQQRSGKADVVNEHWRRVCCGYASLRLVGMRFKLALPIYYLMAKKGYQIYKS